MVADKGNRIEKKIISMMLQFPEILPEVARRNVIDFFEDGTLKSIGQIILTHGNGSGDLVSEIMAMIDDDERKRIIASLAIEEEMWSFRECVKLIAKFMEVSSNQSKKALVEKIKAAEKENNQDLLVELLYEKQKMAVINEKRKMAILSEKMK
jgi:DNA primase